MKLPSRLNLLGVVVFAAAGCATAPPPQTAQTTPTTPAVNVTGNWQGVWNCDNDPGHPGLMVLGLTQTGTSVTGRTSQTNWSYNQAGLVEGTVSGDNLRAKGPYVSADMKVSGDKMVGTFKDGCTGKLTLSREPFYGIARFSNMATTAAIVDAIDAGNRMVTLHGPQGNIRTFKVDPRVNLGQFAVGDVVNVAFYESWAMNLTKPGDPAGAQSGQVPPPGYAAQPITIPATVVSKDGAKPSATFRGPQGRSVEVLVSDPTVLSRLNVGETYDVAYTDALVVMVTMGAK